MKPIIFSFLLFITIANASEKSARSNYLNENYLKSKQDYIKLVQTNEFNFSHHYNLGSVYFRLDNYVMAKVHFLKALKIRPNDSDTQSNIDLINKRFIDKQFLFSNHWPHFFGMSFTSVFSILLVMNVGILSLCLMIYKRTSQNKVKRPMIIFSIIWGSFFLISMVLQFNLNDYGVVISEKTQVYSGPSKSQKSLFFAHQGAEYKILHSSKSWTNVQFSNGLKGWIEGIYSINI